jgi:adenine-specific DNA-methyltransferase
MKQPMPNNKPKFETPNLIAENIAKIAELFPGAVSEGKVNIDLLRAMLGEEVFGDEAYEFTWVGKRAAIAEAGRPIRKTLRPCPDESRDWDTTENLYIEGDNLDVLKLLQESYLGKVKMVYIDPPYNTGNDFVYRDSFAQSREDYDENAGVYDEEGDRLFKNTETNGRFHSDWCSMIYPRLVLARNLLTPDGVIFISISEEEVHTLKQICNEVFGESNFRNAIFTRRYDKNLNRQFMEQGLATMNTGLEYILMYSRVQTTTYNPVFRPSSEERSSQGYWKGYWNDADRPTMRYDVLGVTPTSGQWKWKRELANEAVANYALYAEKFSATMTLEEYWESTGKKKKFIRRNQNGKGKNQGVEHWVAPADGILRNTNWSDLLASKPTGVDVPFDSPKNVDVLQELIRLSNVYEDGIILDFFSGSATTAHAVMQLNAEDGGKRKFIMVQLPEVCAEGTEAAKAKYSNICEIGKERIRRAGDKIKAEVGLTAQDLDIGFRVLKLDDTNMNDVYYAAADYTQDMLIDMQSNIKEDRTDMDLLFGCLLDWGLPLSMPHTHEVIEGYTVHTYNNGDLIACFEEKVPESVVREIASRKPLRAVFRDASFTSSPEKINVFEIFKLLAPHTKVKVI